MAKKSNKPETLNNQAKDTGKKKEKTRAVAMAESRAKQSRNKTKQQKQKQRGSIKEYFKGVRLEMKKVVWPTRKELGSYTAVVLATCAAFALLFWGVDSGVLAAIKAICF
ncbi:MAG: preprotein translocase subunit SecE [Firmicutes bacterium]|nr:preprotein translocase subunit SecE [Bacillota bacterium]